MLKSSIHISYMNSRYGEISGALELPPFALLDPNDHSIEIKCLKEVLYDNTRAVFAANSLRTTDPPIVKRLLPRQISVRETRPTLSLNHLVKSCRRGETVGALLGWSALQDLLRQRFGLPSCPSCGSALCDPDTVDISRSLNTTSNWPSEKHLQQTIGNFQSNESKSIALVAILPTRGKTEDLLASQLLELATQGFRRFLLWREDTRSSIYRVGESTAEQALATARLLMTEARGDWSNLGVLVERFQLPDDYHGDGSIVSDAVARCEILQPEELWLSELIVEEKPKAQQALQLAAHKQQVWRRWFVCHPCQKRFSREQVRWTLPGMFEKGKSAEPKNAEEVARVLSNLQRLLLQSNAGSDSSGLTDNSEIEQINDLATLIDHLSLLDLCELGFDSRVRELTLGTQLHLHFLALLREQLSDCLLIIDSPTEVLSFEQLRALIILSQKWLRLGNTLLLIGDSTSFETLLSVEALKEFSVVTPKSIRIEDWQKRLEVIEAGVVPTVVKPRNGAILGKRFGEASVLELDHFLHDDSHDRPFPLFIFATGKHSEVFASESEERQRVRVLETLQATTNFAKVLSFVSGNAWRTDFAGRRHHAKRHGIRAPLCVDEILGISTHLAELFAGSAAARKLALPAAAFLRGGSVYACSNCHGSGCVFFEERNTVWIESVCSNCSGSGYGQAVLEVTRFGQTLHDLRQMTLEELAPLVAAEIVIGRAVHAAVRSGCGELRLADHAEFLSDDQLVRLVLAWLQLREIEQTRTLLLLDGMLAPSNNQTLGMVVEQLSQLARVGICGVVLFRPNH